MIKERDVIRMKVPFPSVRDDLALQAHMYICRNESVPEYGFLKCQTVKPWMIGSDTIAHYVDEPADPSRNPFRHDSRIDCDKLFVTSGVKYEDGLKTDIRPDICQELYESVKAELDADGYLSIRIDESDLVRINPFINWI